MNRINSSGCDQRNDPYDRQSVRVRLEPIIFRWLYLSISKCKERKKSFPNGRKELDSNSDKLSLQTFLLEEEIHIQEDPKERSFRECRLKKSDYLVVVDAVLDNIKTDILKYWKPIQLDLSCCKCASWGQILQLFRQFLKRLNIIQKNLQFSGGTFLHSYIIFLWWKKT